MSDKHEYSNSESTVVKIQREQREFTRATNPTEGERILAILKKVGYLGSFSDVSNLSENHKDYLDWGNKV